MLHFRVMLCKLLIWKLLKLNGLKTKCPVSLDPSLSVSHKIGGQCNCKAAVTGRQCDRCLPGWYGLSATNPDGCTSCNCSDQGTMSPSTEAVFICNQDTGQCQCKPHVTGKSVNNPANDCICVSKKTVVFIFT